MTAVRPFLESDVPQVADLHRRIFRTEGIVSGGWQPAYRKYFSEVFLNTGLHAGPTTSLVYERAGVVRGFLGVMPRRMTFNGRPVVMAVCSQFVVDPAERGQAGLQMLRRCFDGPQDLSMTDEAGDNTRKIWEWCGGTAVLSYSSQWSRALRPAQAALAAILDRRPSLGHFTRPFRVVARMVDALASWVPPFRLAAPTGSCEDLDDSTFLACAFDSACGHALGPSYDRRTAEWILERAGRRPDHGPLRKVAVRGPQGAVSGWFAYCISRCGVAEVLQVVARRDLARRILDHLCADAREHGATALCGRFEPALAAELSRAGFVPRQRFWTLIHSRNSDLLSAIHRGDAFLTRLEGEWCLRFP